MSLRAGMSYLIDRVRTLANDVPAEVINLTNQQVQDALDEHRKESRYEPLQGLETIFSGGSVQYLTFQAERGWWEGIPYSSGGSAQYYGGTAGYALVDGTFGTVTPATADPLTGRWTFSGSATPPYGPTRPVSIIGFAYDPYAAAADILEIRASQVSEHFDFKDAGIEYTRSQKQKMVLEMVERYRARSWPTFGEMVRFDTC